jgi:hypothetical protein
MADFRKIATSKRASKANPESLRRIPSYQPAAPAREILNCSLNSPRTLAGGAARASPCAGSSFLTLVNFPFVSVPAWSRVAISESRSRSRAPGSRPRGFGSEPVSMRPPVPNYRLVTVQVFRLFRTHPSRELGLQAKSGILRATAWRGRACAPQSGREEPCGQCRCRRGWAENLTLAALAPARSRPAGSGPICDRWRPDRGTDSAYRIL